MLLQHDTRRQSSSRSKPCVRKCRIKTHKSSLSDYQDVFTLVRSSPAAFSTLASSSLYNISPTKAPSLGSALDLETNRYPIALSKHAAPSTAPATQYKTFVGYKLYPKTSTALPTPYRYRVLPLPNPSIRAHRLSVPLNLLHLSQHLHVTAFPGNARSLAGASASASPPTDYINHCSFVLSVLFFSSVSIPYNHPSVRHLLTTLQLCLLA
jgi:hypothetical protein